MYSSDVIRCYFCEDMMRLNVVHHNHKRCLRSEKIKCDCGCWQNFIKDSILAQDNEEQARVDLQTEVKKMSNGTWVTGGRVLPKVSDPYAK